MFNQLVVSLILLFTFTKNQIFSNPIDVLEPFEVRGGGSALAYQGWERQKTQNAAPNREKRFLDCIMEFFSLIDDYFDSDEDEDSSEENNNITETSDKRPGKHAESFADNRTNPVQHVLATGVPLNTQQLKNPIPRQEVATSIVKSPQDERALKAVATNEKETKAPLEAFEKPVSTTSIQETLAKGISSLTASTAINPMEASESSATTPQAITSAVEGEEEKP